MLTSPTTGPRLAPRSARLYATLATCLLSLAQVAAWAQGPIPGSPSGGQMDPPGRIARLNLLEGAVGFAPADAANVSERSAWTAATLNRPLTTGDRLWSGQRSRTELHIGSSAVRMSEQTSLDFLTLDDHLTQMRLTQGSIQLRVRTLFEGQRLEIDTPNLAFVISQPGDYRVDANPASNTTRVVAQSGAGVIYGDSGQPLRLGNQQQVSFTGTRLTPAAPGASAQDGFDAWALARDQREDQSVSARYVPRETVGYQQLDTYGDWSQDPSYGAVWLPRAVPVNWAPYRAGHWSWIAPWGWTWIDDAPWGFAPFHYGRWAQIGPRWAWVPGRLAANPVYAPALVAFIGGGSAGLGWNLSIGYGGAPQPSVGWFPLAPGEAYQPAYQASPRYITQINNSMVINNTVNITQVYRYQHQPTALTVVRSADFSRSQPVRGALPQRTDWRALQNPTTANTAAATPFAAPTGQVMPASTVAVKHDATEATARASADLPQRETQHEFRRDLARPGVQAATAQTQLPVAAMTHMDPRAAAKRAPVDPVGHAPRNPQVNPAQPPQAQTVQRNRPQAERPAQQAPATQADQQRKSVKPQRAPPADERPQRQQAQTRRAEPAPATTSRANSVASRTREQQKSDGRKKVV